MWLVEVIVYGVLVTIILACEILVYRLLLGYVLNEVRYHVMVLVLPWLHTSPVVVEALLYYLHVFSGSLLCIALHLSVKRGVNLQTVAIEVDTLQTLVLLTQLFDILRYSLTEILRLSVIVVLHVKLRYVNAGILGINILLCCEVVMVTHILQHHIASCQCVIRM